MSLLLKLQHALPPEYTATGYIDQGGQGTVFDGTLRGERVALKLFAASSDQRRIDREVDLLSQIGTPYLVKLRGATTIVIDGVQYPLVAYEFLDGGDLRQFQDPAGPRLGTDGLITLGLQIGTAIEALWAKRICHRDIKPGNIVRTVGRNVLVDVGLARHLDRSNLTAPGLSPGTMGYMSPEQAHGRRDLTIRSDMFSLGLTLYELAANHPYGHNQFSIGVILPRPLGECRPDLPGPLTQLIDQMMSTRLSERPVNVSGRFRALSGG